MREVAAELGISDVGLKGVCERHRVPVPPRGYWNHSPGKRPKKAIFVEVQELYLNRVHIQGALTALPDATRAILEKSKRERHSPPSLPPATQALPPNTPAMPIHPFIRATAKALGAAKVDERGSLVVKGPGIVPIEAGPSCVPRIVAFLSNLASTLEARGHQLIQSDRGLALGTSADLIYFTITELTKRINHVATTEEIERSEASEKAAQRKARNIWVFDYWRPAKYEWLRNGVLSFRIDRYNAPYRRQWTDGSVQTIESVLDGIAVGLVTALNVEKSERIERERRADIARRAQRHAELKRQWAEREKLRRAFLDDLAAVERRVKLLKSWIDSQPPTPVGALGRLLNWAKAEQASLSAQLEPEAVSKALEQRGLFPDPDLLGTELADLDAL
jgi:hypothetical protein